MLLICTETIEELAHFTSSVTLWVQNWGSFAVLVVQGVQKRRRHHTNDTMTDTIIDVKKLLSRFTDKKLKALSNR
jgi:hypothetical protein